MPWRLITAIAAFVILLVFVSFNLDNKCDVNFGFARFEAVPVFLTIFISFVLGFLGTLPFVFLAGNKRKNIPTRDLKMREIKSEKKAPVTDAVEKDGKPDGGSKDD